MMELQDLSPESTTPRNKSLEDSQDLLAESIQNISFYNSQDNEGAIPQIISQKNRKKGRKNIFRSYINLLIVQYNLSPNKNKILILISLIIIFITLFIKLFIYFVMMISLIKRIKHLHQFIFDRILDDIKSNYIYFFMNYFFLIIGFIIFFIEIFCQFIIRYKTLLTINECSLKPLILSKCLYFVSLGLIPEVIFANIPFKSKKNIFLSFYKMKFIQQPYIIIILIIYFLFTLCTGSGFTKKEKILNEIKSIKKTVNDFVDKYIFVWNNFYEKDIIDDKEKEKKKEEDKKENVDNKLKKPGEDLRRRKTMVNFEKNLQFGKVIRRKRKGSKDENEDKSKFQKLLGNIDENEEEDDEENKKKNGFMEKITNMKNKVKLLWKDNIFIRMKNYFILGIIGFIISVPVINGIFGYGYYVFYESQIDHFFQIDILLSFGYGLTLILLTND